MNTHLICTKSSYLSVFYLELCRRTKMRCIFIIVFCAGLIPCIEICLNGKDALKPGLIVLFVILFYVFWKVVYKGLKKIAEKFVDKIWANRTEFTFCLDITETGLWVFFDNADAPSSEIKPSEITRIETINGYTAIFTNCGRTKDGLTFVCTEDVTEALKQWLQRKIIDGESVG